MTPPPHDTSAGMTPRARWNANTRLQIWVGLVLAVGTLYLAVRTVDFGQLAQVLRAAQPIFILLTLVSSLATTFLKALRWQALFHPRRPRLSLLRLSDLIVIGQAVNFYIPTRLGELARAYLTGEEAGLSKSYALGTIAAEKLMDIIVLAVLVIGLLPFLALPDWLSTRLGPLIVAALAVTIGLVVLLGGQGLVLRLADGALRLLPSGWAARWRERIRAGLAGLSALGQPRAALAVWGWTVAFWAMAALTNYLLLFAFDLPRSPLIALFLLAVLQAGVAVPSTPGKIGVFHYLCVIALAVFHVPETVALAYGLTLHALVVGGVSVWAAIALWRRSWSLRQLAAASQASPAE